MTGVPRGNKRSTARLAAVQALYQMDLSGSDVFATMVEFETYRLGKDIDGDVYGAADPAFFRDIVGGVVREQRVLDPLIDTALAEGWPLTRIDSTLRQILRAGAYELRHRRDVPAKAAISEYVDVARAFFDKGDEAGIVNAVLDRLARAARPQDFGAAADHA
jgi:transcription antitermination protein NusB